ncbi:MAG: ATP-binding protein [Sterolibacterium sp.]
MSILAAAIVMLYPLKLEQQLPREGAILALAIVGALTGALVVYLLTFPHGMAIIHRGIRRATEGTLKPIETTRRIRFFFGPIVNDYNILIRNIGSLFHEMEQSQLAIIGDRNRNDAILRSLPGALLTVDSDFRVTLSNKQAEHLFDMDNAGLLGKNLFELLSLNEDGRDLLREAFLYELQVTNKEVVLTNGSGARHYTLNVTFFRESQNASESCAAVMLQDVTEYKRLQELIHQSEKFLAIGQLAGGVAHELNTPLGTIVGYAQLLNEGVASEERRLEYGQRIYHEAKRCAHIIENLRAVAQRDVCHPETCSINSVIADVVDTVSNCPSKTHNARIVTSLGCDAMVQGGAGQLDIVLVNVLMNAVQAATGASRDPRVTIATSVNADSVQVSIADNGPGIPVAQRNQVFDPFFTTKKDCAGIGLGLAISRSIVTRIGGSLSCDTEFAGGARFILTLPLVRREGM